MSKNSTGLLFEQRTSLGEILQSRQDFVTSQLQEAVRITPRARILCVRGRTVGDWEPAWTPPDWERGLWPGLPHSPGKTPQSRFDYICAPDLLDELGEGPAREFVARLIDLLAEGGTLLLASLAPEVQSVSPDIFEAVPELHCRTEWEMAGLVTEGEDEDTVGHAAWRSEDGATVYLEVRK